MKKSWGEWVKLNLQALKNTFEIAFHNFKRVSFHKSFLKNTKVFPASSLSLNQKQNRLPLQTTITLQIMC